jgi:uncharacterized membrane protein
MMIEAMTKDPARKFLIEVEEALHDLDPDLRQDLLSGLAEELRGLAPDAARERIEQMGPPSLIAAEARIQVEGQLSNQETNRKVEPAWYSTVGALFITVGGIVLPVVGAIIGYAMLWISRDWTRRDKKIATWTVALATTVSAVVVAVVLANASSDPLDAPLIPRWFDAVSNGMIFVQLVNVIVGIRLLARRNSR